MGSAHPMLAFLLMTISGSVYRRQLLVIDMLQAENRLLRALASKRFLIIDRDTKYTAHFRRLVDEAGAAVIRLSPMWPNLNAYAERFVRSIKAECLERMIFVGQASLRRAIAEYVAHYHAERNHQGLQNRIPVWVRPDTANDASVLCRQRLGGLLNYYHRAAA